MSHEHKGIPSRVVHARLGRLEFAALPTELAGSNPATGYMPSFLVRFMTINAAASTPLDTGYQPPLGHAADLWVPQYCITDTVNNVAKSGSGFGCIKQLVSGAGIVGQTWATHAADGALATAVPSFDIIEATGNLGLVFTPPAAYVGNLEWCFLLRILEN